MGVNLRQAFIIAAKNRRLHPKNQLGNNYLAITDSLCGTLLKKCRPASINLQKQHLHSSLQWTIRVATNKETVSSICFSSFHTQTYAMNSGSRLKIGQIAVINQSNWKHTTCASAHVWYTHCEVRSCERNIGQTCQQSPDCVSSTKNNIHTRTQGWSHSPLRHLHHEAVVVRSPEYFHSVCQHMWLLFLLSYAVSQQLPSCPRVLLSSPDPQYCPWL